MKNALAHSHDLLGALISHFPQGTFVDATLGKGNDSAFILQSPLFNGRVIGIDIQAKAIQISQERLSAFNYDNLHLIQADHADLELYFDQLNCQLIHGAIFNLGYLPGANHQIATHKNSTYKALNAIAKRLVPQGQIILVIYSGHSQGAEEKSFLLEALRTWPQDQFTIAHLDYLNQINSPPSLLIIERNNN